MNNEEVNLWEIHKLACEWVRFADSKASITLATQGVIATMALPPLIPLAKTLLANPGMATLIGLSAVSAAFSGFFAIKAIVPRLSVGAPKSAIFFDHIALHKDAASYATQVHSMIDDPQEMRRQLSDQIWANSLVARKKIRATRVAILMLGTSLLLALVAALYNFLLLAVS